VMLSRYGGGCGRSEKATDKIKTAPKVPFRVTGF
jgi:hypothetical protein